MNTLVIALPFMGQKNRVIYIKTYLISLFWKVLLASLSILILSFIFGVNEVSRAQYIAKSHETKLYNLSENLKSLEIGVSQQNSLSNIEFLLKSLNFEPVSKVHYIVIPETKVVSTNINNK